MCWNASHKIGNMVLCILFRHFSWVQRFLREKTNRVFTFQLIFLRHCTWRPTAECNFPLFFNISNELKFVTNAPMILMGDRRCQRFTNTIFGHLKNPNIKSLCLLRTGDSDSVCFRNHMQGPTGRFFNIGFESDIEDKIESWAGSDQVEVLKYSMWYLRVSQFF